MASSIAGHSQYIMLCPEAEMIMCGGDGHLWASVVLMWSFLLSFQWAQKKNKRRKEKEETAVLSVGTVLLVPVNLISISIVLLMSHNYPEDTQCNCTVDLLRNCKEKPLFKEFEIKLYLELTLYNISTDIISPSITRQSLFSDNDIAPSIISIYCKPFLYEFKAYYQLRYHTKQLF